MTREELRAALDDVQTVLAKVYSTPADSYLISRARFTLMDVCDRIDREGIEVAESATPSPAEGVIVELTKVPGAHVAKIQGTDKAAAAGEIDLAIGRLVARYPRDFGVVGFLFVEESPLRFTLDETLEGSPPSAGRPGAIRLPEAQDDPHAGWPPGDWPCTCPRCASSSVAIQLDAGRLSDVRSITCRRCAHTFTDAELRAARTAAFRGPRPGGGVSDA